MCDQNGRNELFTNVNQSIVRQSILMNSRVLIYCLTEDINIGLYVCVIVNKYLELVNYWSIRKLSECKLIYVESIVIKCTNNYEICAMRKI